MKSICRIIVVACAVVLTGPLHAEQECEFLSEADAEWMRGTLQQWRQTASEDLGLEDTSLPWVIFFDKTCSWNINASERVLETLAEAERLYHGTLAYAGNGLPVTGYSHDGNIRLPEGGEIPPQLILFASTYGEAPAPYMVMAMPEIWRGTPHHADDPEAELDRLIRSVFVHEMTHTAQSGVFGSRLDEIIAQNGLNDDAVDDDMVQRRFAAEHGFSASVDQERKLLFESAITADRQKAGILVAEAVSLIRDRHAGWLSGENAHLAEIEDIFLYMEGVANWAAYRALLDQGMKPEEALPVLRRGGRSWTQDEGLAMFLAIDRLMPGWEAMAMSDKPGSVLSLLERAAGKTVKR